MTIKNTNQRGEIHMHLILTIFLGIGMVLFGVLAVLAYSERQDAVNNLNQKVTKAVKDAVQQQKDDDAEANRKANDQPYRSYSAEPVDGGFQLQIPKTWSIVVNKNTDNTTQTEVLANPEAVVKNMAQGSINTQAFKLQLLKRGQTETIKYYDSLIKQKKVTSRGAQVSGINATRFEGQIDQQRHNGIVYVLPVRDKTMVIMTENMRYKDEFEKIISSAKINP